VTVRELTLLGLEHGLARLRITSTAGFYVRSLAHDLGVALGCGGHLETLRRTRAGVFGLDRALRFDDLDLRPQAAVDYLVPLSRLVLDLSAVRLTPRGTVRVSHGNSVSVQDFTLLGSEPEREGPDAGMRSGSLPGPGARVRVFDGADRLLAIAEIGPDGVLRPSVVLV
jgi:tRNA U55 pseudouridine synthase TruB